LPSPTPSLPLPPVPLPTPTLPLPTPTLLTQAEAIARCLSLGLIDDLLNDHDAVDRCVDDLTHRPTPIVRHGTVEICRFRQPMRDGLSGLAEGQLWRRRAASAAQ
jgi:hypothetical protein